MVPPLYVLQLTEQLQREADLSGIAAVAHRFREPLLVLASGLSPDSALVPAVAGLQLKASEQARPEVVVQAAALPGSLAGND